MSTGSNNSFIGGGTSNTTSCANSTIGGGQNNTIGTQGHSFIGGGRANSVTSCAGFIGGGFCNSVTNKYSTIAGGYGNLNSGYRSAILGGQGNNVSNACSIIGGGFQNCVSGVHSSILGGFKNSACANCSAILGGSGNTISSACAHAMVIGSNITVNRACTTFVNDMTIVSMAACSGCGVGVSTNGLLIPVTPGGGAAPIMILGAGTCSTIRCGVSNTAANSYAAALGGQKNTSDSNNSVIAGGFSSNISNCSDFGGIVGGYCNNIYSAPISFIGGGYTNKICIFSCLSTIGGGFKNIILGYNAKNTCSFCSTIVGGSANYICRSKDSFIGGGGGNSNLASNATVIGGGALNCNIATSTLSTIGGGLCNVHNASLFGFIGGGYKNASSADLTVIGGGSYNVINQIQGVIGGGYVNTINSIDSSILGGVYNTVTAGYTNIHIIGSNITGNISNYTFVNNLCSAGQVNKAGGSFVINHPDPLKTKTTQLIHSFVESPTAGDNIYRFKVTIIDGIGEIILPDYYKFLNENTQVWVSPINGFGIGYGEINEELTKILITANLDMEYNVLVIGTRKDEHAKKYWKGTERLKPKNNDKKTLI